MKADRQLPIHKKVPDAYGGRTAQIQPFQGKFRGLVMRGLSAIARGNPARIQIALYGAIDIIETVIDIGIYLALTRNLAFFGAHIFFSKALTFIIATVPTFVLNRTWTFDTPRPVTFSEVAKFYAVALTSLLANIVIMYLLIRWFGLYDVFAALVGGFGPFLVGFLVNRLWVFSAKEPVRHGRAFHTMFQP